MPNERIHFPLLARRGHYPKKKSYEEYRPFIREDCKYRCVYCDVHENENGGDKEMTLDHLRPKSKSEYKKLEHDPINLVLACHTCNNLKGNDWPAYGTNETHVNGAGYLDPFKIDRLDYFEVEGDGELRAVQEPSGYMIFRLDLNRAFLRKIRQIRTFGPMFLDRMVKHFQTEIGTLDILISSDDVSDLEIARLKEEKRQIREQLADVERMKGLLDTN